jgi:hydrogenase nickel incorporation protein HypA/HybF
VHEFSIAEALAAQVLRYAPDGGRVREVEIRVGVLRGLDPEAMSMSWQAVTTGTELEGCSLKMDIRPWTLSCGQCGRRWTSPVPFVDCECGNQVPVPTGGDEMDLVALAVDDPQVEVDEQT